LIEPEDADAEEEEAWLRTCSGAACAVSVRSHYRESSFRFNLFFKLSAYLSIF